MLSSSGDGTARLWDLATGKELRRFLGQTEVGLDATFTPDGRLTLICSLDKANGPVIRVVDVATGRELRQLRGHTAKVDTLAVSPDSRILVSGSWPDDPADLGSGQRRGNRLLPLGHKPAKRSIHARRAARDLAL